MSLLHQLMAAFSFFYCGSLTLFSQLYLFLYFLHLTGIPLFFRAFFFKTHFTTLSPANPSFSTHTKHLLCSSTFTKTHRDEQQPNGAVLPTQQASSVGSWVPGLSQGVGLRLRQPLPCPHCYCTGSSVHIVSTKTVRKTGIWRNADAAGESRCNRHRDPFTWINIVLPAAARLTKQKDYYTQQSFIWVVVRFDKWTRFFFPPTTWEKRFLFSRGATNIALVALGWKLLLPSSGNFWYLHPLDPQFINLSIHMCTCIYTFSAFVKVWTLAFKNTLEKVEVLQRSTGF